MVREQPVYQNQMNKGETDISKLSEIQEEIRDALQGRFPAARWIVAEISEIKENYSGHCYLDLVEKDEKSDKLLAKARATIWSTTYRMLKPYFETTTGYALVAGIKIMVSALVEYHPVYGLSLNIRDIDPGYTLGDVERKRQEILNRLEKEGVLNMNRETLLPAVPQKIAVISSKTAAGYEDFVDQLLNNPFGYKFYLKLFPAAMQGENAESTIIRALEQIFSYGELFDLVVIIRGGGSKSDLACFDSYDLAFHVAQFPMPVITGIGHEQDDTITDMVAHTRLKTPTAVAGFLVDRLAAFEAALDEYGEALVKTSRNILHEKALQLQLRSQKFSAASRKFLSTKSEEYLRFTARSRHVVLQVLADHSVRMLRLGEKLKNSAKNLPERKRTELRHATGRLKRQVHTLFGMEYRRLENYVKLKSYAEPAHILKLGFSISRSGGRALKDAASLNPGDLVETELDRGKFGSRVIDIKKNFTLAEQRKDAADS